MIYIVSVFYIGEKIKSQRDVKEVRIFYMQNNKQRAELGIEYKKFDIYKEYIKFYSNRIRCNVVIPIKE